MSEQLSTYYEYGSNSHGQQGTVICLKFVTILVQIFFSSRYADGHRDIKHLNALTRKYSNQMHEFGQISRYFIWQVSFQIQLFFQLCTCCHRVWFNQLIDSHQFPSYLLFSPNNGVKTNNNNKENLRFAKVHPHAKKTR